MMRKFALMTLLTLAGCLAENAIEPVMCTKEFVYGLHTTIRDAATNQAIAQEAILTLQDGSYEEVVTDSWDGLTLVGAGERPGTYTVTVERSAYLTWSVSGLEITADECHVIPVSLAIRLTSVS